MTSRSIRRAAERKAKKLARKAEATVVRTSSSAAVALPLDLPLTPAQASTQPDAKPISPAQLAANRVNAQLSTGPRTEAGKARSARNAVKSALTGQTVLLPNDDVDEYAALVAAFQHDLAPVGQAECELVQSIVDTHWRLRRIQALEFALYAHGHEQFEEAFADYPEGVRYNMILLQTDMTYEKQLRNYHIHEARLHRRRDKDMAELRRLQADRKDGARNTEAAKAKEIGFAFSNHHSVPAISEQNRDREEAEMGYSSQSRIAIYPSSQAA
jgi:hypothetical protein